MTAITRSAIKRKAEALATSDCNKVPKQLFPSSCDCILEDSVVTADRINACKLDLFPTADRLVGFSLLQFVLHSFT